MNVPELRTVRAIQRRRTKLILPRLQLWLIGTLTGTASLALVAQYQILTTRLAEFAQTMPSGGSYLAQEIPRLTTGMLLISFGLLLPTIVGLGVLVTFRIAGPIFRFKQHLDAVARGEDVGPCRVRRGDLLHDLCASINQAVGTLRADAKEAAVPAALPAEEPPRDAA
jgi:hypothetical protein